MSTALGFDCSNYTQNLSPQTASALLEAGASRALVACQFPDVYHEQQQILANAGIATEAWIYLYNSKGPFVQQTKSALQTIGGTVPRLWLDIEDTSTPWVYDIEADIMDSLDEIRRAGLQCGIYTGAWFWKQYLPTFTPGPGVRLWLANYDNDPETYSADFGGWRYCSVKQYQGGASLAGVTNIDLDSWFD